MYSTNSHDGVVTQHGGLSRTSHGGPVQDELARRHTEEPQPARVGGTYVRANIRTGEVESLPSFASHKHSPDRPNPTGSVMQSMRMEGGNRTVELSPGDPSSRTLLAVALREGLVVETAPGIYSDRATPGQGQQAAQEVLQGSDQDQEADPLAGTIYDRAEFAIWSEEIESISQHTHDRAVAGVTAALATANPAKLEGVIHSLAQDAGMEPEQAREFVETGIEWYSEWAAAGSIDTDLSFLSLLELYGTEISERRMPARRVVEALDVIEYV